MNKLIDLKFYKSPKFYVSLIAIVLLVFGSFFYCFVSKNIEITSTMNYGVLIISLSCILIYFVLLIFKPTSEYSSLVSWILSFVIFLIYINSIYMYFAGVFYNGISGAAIAAMDKGILFSLIFILLSCIVGNVAIYIPCKKEGNK